MPRFPPVLTLLFAVVLPSAFAQAPASAPEVPAAAPQVAITFDDLPSTSDLPRGQSSMGVAHSILNTIHAQHLPPVYGFLNAATLEDSPDERSVLKAWRAAGQPLGNHSYSHMSANEFMPGEFEADIRMDEPVLRSLMRGPANDWHWFRFPYLYEGDTLEKRRHIRAWLAAHHYRIAEVSLDFEDDLWNNPYARCSAKQDTAAIAWLQTSYLATADQYITFFRDLTHTLYGRDIPYVLLLHIGAFDAKMFPSLIELFRSRGFTFTTLPAAMADPAYRDDPDIALAFGGTFQEQLATARHIAIPPNEKPYKQLEALCR